MSDTGGVREVKSAARTVELLELLAARGDRPARLQELADALGVPRSSMYALLQTLIARGWVRTDVTGSLYGIGIHALLTGTGYLDSDPRVRAVRPYLDEASEALGETIHMGRLDGRDVAYLATRESHEYLRTISRVGRRLPAHVGRAGQGAAGGAGRRGAARGALRGAHPELAHEPGVPAGRPRRVRARATPWTGRRASSASSASASPCATTRPRRTRSAARCRWPG